jgi:hypothetical protein
MTDDPYEARYELDRDEAARARRRADQEHLDDIHTPPRSPVKGLERDEDNWSHAEFHRLQTVAADDRDLLAAARMTSTHDIDAESPPAPPPPPEPPPPEESDALGL